MKEYKIIESLPYCCVCAVVESIALRHNYFISQCDLANFAGLVCSKDDLCSLPKALINIRTSEVPYEWGIHMRKTTISDFFLSRNIPLKETFISVNQFDELSFEYILSSTSKNFDIMFFISHGALYGNQENVDVGHCVLFLGYENDNISYLDPGPENLGLNKVSLYDMFLAMKQRGNYDAGISIISPL